MCSTKRFRINAHRALKALLFPITKTPEYFSSKYKNQVFSFALLGSHTVETLLGGILQRGKKKKKKYHKHNRSNWSQMHKILEIFQGFVALLVSADLFPQSQFSLCASGFIRSIRMN